MLQPKCGENRLGYCDESEKDWAACPIGRVRPHKDVLFRVYEQYRRGELQPLRPEDYEVIEGAGEMGAPSDVAIPSPGS
jgi:thymidylate synthase (FAD)